MSIMRGGVMSGGIMRSGVMRGGIMLSQRHPIAALFARLGGTGFFVDPLDHNQVWADTAGTLHPARGATVARLDAGVHSPVAASFQNATVAQQPILRADGLEYDSVDDRLVYPDDPALRFGTVSWTTAFAAYADVVTGFRTIIDKRSSAGGPGWNFGLYDDTGRLRIVLQDATQTKLGYLQPSAGWVAGQWVDVIVEIDRGSAEARGYINGVYQSANDVALGTLGDISGTQPIAMGSTSDGQQRWDGKLGRKLAIDKLLSASDRAIVNDWLAAGHA